jgi:hypothetical protein
MHLLSAISSFSPLFVAIGEGEALANGYVAIVVFVITGICLIISQLPKVRKDLRAQGLCFLVAETFVILFTIPKGETYTNGYVVFIMLVIAGNCLIISQLPIVRKDLRAQGLCLLVAIIFAIIGWLCYIM